jgi:hypothetical protein
MLSKKNPGGIIGQTESVSTGSSDEEESLWFKANLALVEPNATKWFEDLGPISVQDHFRRQVNHQTELRSCSVFLEGKIEASIIPSMQIEPDELGEIQPIESTEIGRAMIAALGSKGVTYSYVDTFPINHYQSVQVEAKNILEGQWGTEIGTPFVQRFKVYKNKEGKETGLWYVDLLASPLPLTIANQFQVEIDGEFVTLGVPDEDLAAGMLSYGEISSRVHLPIFLKNLAFLAETPFPSNQLMSFSRDLAFEEQIPNSARPIPTFAILKDDAFMSFAGNKNVANGSSSNTYKGQIVPELVVFGWRFEKKSIPHLPEILPTIVDGCTYAVSTIENGYGYFRREDTPIDYDSVLSNPTIYAGAYQRGGSRLASAQWIPVTAMGDMITRCEIEIARAEQLHESGDSEAAENAFFDLWLDGIGRYLASAINSLAYSFLIPRLAKDPDDLRTVEFALGQAISLNVFHESNNARNNLGLARLMAGKLEAAEQILLEVTEITDFEGYAEANHYLSLVYAKLGKAELQNKYEAASQAAGGFAAPEWIAQGLEIKTALGQKTESNFCVNCGSKFASDSNKFCGSCGVARS